MTTISSEQFHGEVRIQCLQIGEGAGVWGVRLRVCGFGLKGNLLESSRGKPALSFLHIPRVFG